jgi:hypothetical protein
MLGRCASYLFIKLDESGFELLVDVSAEMVGELGLR